MSVSFTLSKAKNKWSQLTGYGGERHTSEKEERKSQSKSIKQKVPSEAIRSRMPLFLRPRQMLVRGRRSKKKVSFPLLFSLSFFLLTTLNCLIDMWCLCLWCKKVTPLILVQFCKWSETTEWREKREKTLFNQWKQVKCMCVCVCICAFEK